MTVAAVLCIATVAPANWPQYRADATRSGWTPEQLPRKLSLQWVHRPRHAPRRAWVGRSLARSRMRFDWAYSVVVADGMCFFGSSADDMVHALDAATGEEKWVSVTGGPVRPAPAVWEGKVYAASDDGYLYCLSAREGRELWKLRAGPNGERVIGNGRMVSRWVARGGPAVRDGIVYFGAGIWPIDGVYICAVDAETGKVLWCNDSTGALEIDQPHMVCHSRGGVAAQGYLAVTKDTVLVATGRSTPAAFDRKSGDFRHFHLSRYGGKTPWGTGGGDISATDAVYFNAGMAFDVATGLRYHPVGRRYWWKPYITPDGRKAHGEFLLGDRQVICITPDGLVRSEGAAVFASTLTRKTYDARREADTARDTPHLPIVRMADTKRHLERIDNAPAVRDRWSVKVRSEPRSLVVAGGSIVAGLDGEVVIIDSASKKQVWSAKVDGAVHALAVAGGQLYASTDTGAIYCFGKGNATARTTEARGARVVYRSDSLAAKAAEEIIRKTGITKGLCLDLTCNSDSLLYHLAKRTQLNVIALTSDTGQASHVRCKLGAAGVYGVRVAVVVARPRDLPDYFANLIVSSAALKGGEVGATDKEIARLQRPYGGTVCIGRAGEMKPSVRGELKGAGQWTHNFGDAGNTMDSGDQLVAGPLGMLWYADETQVTIDRHGKNPAPLAYKGLIVREGVETIKCTDAYNGTQVWQVSLPGVLRAYQEGTQVGGGQIGSTCCIAGDVLYVRKDNKCLLLDVFTGRKQGEFTAPKFPNGATGRWAYVACRDGVLYGTLMNESYVIRSQHGDGGPRTQKPMDDHLTESSLFFAMDARTGALKWTFAPKHSIRNTAIAVGKGLVYLIDRPAAEMDKLLKSQFKSKRRGRDELSPHPTGVLLALEAGTGKVRWRDGRDIFGTTLAVSTAHDVLLMGYNSIGFARMSDWGRGMRAWRASSGEVLWSSKQSGKRPAIVGRTVYGLPLAWDLLTGKQKMVVEPRPGQANGTPWRIDGKGQGCGLAAGSKNLLLIRSGALGYYDLSYDRGWMENYGGLRSGCFLNALPVGGIVVAPEDTRACRCSYQNQASVALYRHGVRPPEVDPAPGQTNVRFSRRLKEPVFTGSLVVEMTHERGDVEIRYTLDDTYPTAQSALYRKPITITKTTPIRASAFLGGKKVAVRDVVIFTKRKRGALRRR